MSGMDQFLAEYYGTNAASEEVEKQAQVELFTKLAAENGIDISQLSDDQVNGLWAEFQGELAKTAGEDDKDEKKKVEEAAKEHEEKKAAAEKFAEADFLGRVMAHSYVNELKKIAGAETQARQAAYEHANKPSPRTQAFQQPPSARTQSFQKAPSARTQAYAAANAPGQRTRLMEHAGRHGGGSLTPAETGLLDKAKSLVKEHPYATAGLGLAAAGAAGAGIYAATRDKKKKASALDELAAEYALSKAASAGFDPEEAAERLGAILTLGVSDDNSKVAFAQDLNGAVEVRSLELLEQAGYPVEWTE